MSNSIVVNYKLLRTLRPEFIKKIKFVSVFSRYGTEVMIVTKDDEVYAFGENKNGCLGLGLNKPVDKPTIVNELCNKQILKFAFGLRHSIILTKNGQIYSCGYNEFGQLANRTTVDCYVPKLVIDLLKHFIIDITCGAFHSLALTRAGCVYAWGFNFWGQMGNGNNYNQLMPVKVHGLDSEFIVAIGCGHHSSVALTKTGYVYTWGHNGFGQLGIGNSERYRNIPTRIRVVSDEVFVSKIVCGQNHCLLLSEEGYLYVFGCNYFGQIGIGTKTDQLFAIKISELKFTDIGAALCSNTSVALSINKRTYIWGKCVDERFTTPRETPIKTLDELFARYNYVTYEPLYLNKKKTFIQKVICFANSVKKRLN